MHLQKNIGLIRKLKKLTYQEFGDAVSATEGQAKSYELKGATPPLEIVCNIADFAGLSLDALVREELTPENYSILNHPQPAPGAVKKLQQQIDEMSERLRLLERRSKSVRKRLM